MRFKTWPVAALGLLGLLALTVVSMALAASRAKDIYVSLDELNTYHRSLDQNLARLRLDVGRTEIAGRDYLLDLERGSFTSAPAMVTDYRDRLTTLRKTNESTLADLASLIRPEDQDRLTRLRAKLDAYWQTFDPILTSTPEMIRQGETRYLRRAMVPRRDEILAVAREIQDLNDANLTDQRAAVAKRQENFRLELQRLLWQTVALGLVVALVSVFRLRALERRSELQRTESERAEQEMRRLSQQLVAAQEEERRHLSRELHDHVAQVLTALRMELGRIERIRAADSRVGAAVIECKGLVDRMFRTVRDLTLGLRPAMLDDFGLQPALEWQVRELSRRSSVTVDLQMDGDLDSLPDSHRTCVYRVVQEALTNCARHAQAGRIQVSVARRDVALDVTVSDDGIGFDATRRTGLGLRGIEERVKELQGTATIHSGPRDGTTIVIQLPLPAQAEEVPRARAVG